MLQSLPSRAAARPVVFVTGPMVRLRGLSPQERGEIERWLTIPNPAIAQARRFSGFASRETPRHLYGYALDGDELVIAPGLASRAREYLLSIGREVAIEFDQPQPLGQPCRYVGEDRGYQGSAVERGALRRQGYFVAPCGSGKTDIGVQLIARWGLRTLVIVHTRELMKQWVERIKLRTGIDAHTFGGGSKKQIVGDERVIVATVQMLRKSPTLLALLAGRIQYVIVDECHHTPAATFTNVLAKLNPWVRHGFTATEHRTDGLSAMLHWWIGPKLAEIPREMLEEAGHIVRPLLRVFTTRFESTYDPDEPGDYSRLMAKMHEDGARLALIARQIQHWHHEGRVHIALTGSIEYGYRLFDALAARPGLTAVMCHGKLGKGERAAALELVKTARADVIIATSLADEGLDLPMLTDLWTVTPTRSESKTEQRVGRICRPMPGKPTPRVHDIVDPHVTRQVEDRETGDVKTVRIFVNQFRNRFMRCYKRIADYDISEVRAVLNGGDR